MLFGIPKKLQLSFELLKVKDLILRNFLLSLLESSVLMHNLYKFVLILLKSLCLLE